MWRPRHKSTSEVPRQAFIQWDADVPQPKTRYGFICGQRTTISEDIQLYKFVLHRRRRQRRRQTRRSRSDHFDMASTHFPLWIVRFIHVYIENTYSTFTPFAMLHGAMSHYSFRRDVRHATICLYPAQWQFVWKQIAIYSSVTKRFFWGG